MDARSRRSERALGQQVVSDNRPVATGTSSPNRQERGTHCSPSVTRQSVEHRASMRERRSIRFAIRTVSQRRLSPTSFSASVFSARSRKVTTLPKPSRTDRFSYRALTHTHLAGSAQHLAVVSSCTFLTGEAACSICAWRVAVDGCPRCLPAPIKPANFARGRTTQRSPRCRRSDGATHRPCGYEAPHGRVWFPARRRDGRSGMAANGNVLAGNEMQDRLRDLGTSRRKHARAVPLISKAELGSGRR